MPQQEELPKLLEAEGVSVRPIGDDRLPAWSATFGANTVFVFLDSDEQYYMIVAPIRIKLRDKLEGLGAKQLAALIRTSSEVKLAKLEYLETDKLRALAAVSECSTSGPTGQKLRRRMSACARLAALVEERLG